MANERGAAGASLKNVPSDSRESMTASPINLPSAPPSVGAAATGLFGAGLAVATQGPMAGFGALLDAFFGDQGQAAPGAPAIAITLDGEAAKAVALEESPDKDTEAAAETRDTPLPSTDAQILAALLAQPIAAPAQVPPSEVVKDGAAAGSPAPSAFPPQAAAQTSAMTQAIKAADSEPARAGAVAQTATADTTDSTVETLGVESPETVSAAASPLDDGKPAVARQSATPAPPMIEAPASRSSLAPPPAAMAAAATAAAPPPAPVAEAVEPPLATEIAQVAASDPDPATTAPTATARGKATARAARNEAGRPEAAAPQAVAADGDPTATAVQTETASTFESGSEGKREEAPALVEAKADTDAGQPAAPNVGDLAATASTSAPAEMRAGPQTVAHLAAQIVKKLEGRSTQFDIALNPQDLGRVDVRIEIGAQGKLTASMSFENPQAAAELRGRAGELQKALEQAGFDVSGGIRFDVAADRGQGQAGQDTQNNGGAWRGRAFQAALDSAGETADTALSGALNLQRRTQSGVDVRI